ncbi:glycoside hydrolase family 36 protein [Xylariomycetidae sp. FL0641]|nr:glycoside hydrolase family 36 protein [Xylariomycetidae sp. FL0641]
MSARLSIHPPLGRVTHLISQDIPFYALLEVDSHQTEAPWELALWSSADGREWTEQRLSPATSADTPSHLQETSPTRSYLYFHTAIPISSQLRFTAKFRRGPSEPWEWIRDQQGIDDGTILVSAVDSQRRWSDNLSDVIHGLNPDLKVRSLASQAPRTRLWSVEAAVSPGEGDHSGIADTELGVPWGEYSRYFALVRHGSPWLGPRHGRNHFHLDKHAVICSFLNSQGRHLVLLGISGIDDVITLLRSSSSGSVMIRVRSDATHNSTGTVLVAIGDDFESAVSAVMYHARTLISANPLAEEQRSKEIKAMVDRIRPEWYENWYDGLGYCTWNALGQKLTEEKLLHAVESLAANDIRINSFIIDDNWQDIDYKGSNQYQHGWKSFEAEPNAFPRGLKHTISQIRSKHSTIEHVAVWHALLGYWGGISLEGELAKRYRTIELEREDAHNDGPMSVVASEDVGKFYDDFYRFLSECGIDGVKADVQYMMDTWVSSKHRRELTNEYLDSWSISSLRHFSVKVISCMSQAPQVLFHQQLPRNKPAMLVRNSDDFYPEVPASHPWHLWANAHNTVLTQHLNILPDWDMFQTDHEFAGFHAAARCISGGPIYITDIPGHHNINLINQMTGKTPRGRTSIFRPSVLGRTIDPYTGYDEDAILKVGSYHGRAVTGTPILGVFNTRPGALTEIIPLSCFPGVLSSMKYVVRSHCSGKVTPVAGPDSATAHLTVSLEAQGYDIFTAYGVTRFDSETNGSIHVANLGLIGKMTGAAAIFSTEYELLPTGRVFLQTFLKALGVLGLYISSLPDMAVERDFMVTIQGQPIPAHTVSANKTDTHILDIDVESAWEEMDLDSGWSNEVLVKVYFDIEHP